MAPSPDADDFTGVHVHVLTRHTLLVIALAVSTPLPIEAQQRSEPRLILSAFGGVAGGRHLWTLNRQPLFVLGTESGPRYDTINLSRNIGAGVVIGFAGTFYRSPAFGISAEIVFLGLSTDDRCQMVFENTAFDALGRNASLCADIDAHSVSPSTVGFFAGATYRAFSRGFASPYIRAQFGIGTRSGSTVHVEGAYLDGSVVRRRAVIQERPSAKPMPSAGVALGVMVPLSVGHQVHLELRDQVLSMRQVTGIANSFGTAATSNVLVHSVALTAGIDIVLEQRRGRRY